MYGERALRSNPAPYEALRVLASGETEVVVARAHVPALGFERLVVLKRASDDSAKVRAALVREANAYSRTIHPAIARLYDVFEHGRQVTLVLEHVHGLDLSQILTGLYAEHARLPTEAALFVGARVLSALACAHSARHPISGEFSPVLHRNVSPANVVIPWDGFAKLIDFGAARISGETSADQGVMHGTYGYMAPEQISGESVSVRTDVYAACLLIRELLAGRPTFPNDGIPELELLQAMASPMLADIESLRPELPRALCRALQAGLAPEPDARVLSAEQIVEVLRSEADLELGHRQLVALLGRVRRERMEVSPVDTLRYESVRLKMEPARSQPTIPPPPPVPELTKVPTRAPRMPLATPFAMMQSFSPAAAAPQGSRRWAPLFAGLLITLAGAGTIATMRPDVNATASSLPEASTETPPTLARPASPSLVPEVAPVPAPPLEEWGRLIIEAPRLSRVWVDGQMIGEGPRKLRLRCGIYRVRIGSRSPTREIEVPCGGAVTAN